MKNKTEPKMNAYVSWERDPFPEPRTIPLAWDLSNYASSDNQEVTKPSTSTSEPVNREDTRS